jgi:Transcription factor WhiB
MTAAEDLTRALVELTDHHEVPPCAHNPDAWTSNGASRRAAAARACQSCPVLELCASYADEIHARSGVYGGVDRTPRQRDHRG